MPENREPKSHFFGWINLILLFIIYGALYGFIYYGFSVIFPAMIKATGWGRGDAAMAHTLRGFVIGALAPLTAAAIGKFGAKRTMGTGLFIGVVVMILLGTITTQLWQWIILWGFIVPIAFSFGGTIPSQTIITYWFNIKRGMSLGLVLSASALTGFIAAPLYTYIIQQTGTWKTGWLTAGGFCTLALIIAFFIKNNPADIGQFPDGIDPQDASDTNDKITQQAPKTYRTSETWTLKELVRKPVLYLLALCMISRVSANYLLITHGVLHLTDLGFTSMQAASLIGNLILFNGLARFPMGYLGDRIEPRLIMVIALAGIGLSFIGIWKAPDSMTILLVFASVFGFCYGAMVPAVPTIIGNYFGPQAFAPINGFLSPFILVLSAPVPLVAGIIYDKFHSYDIAFIYCIALVMVGTFGAFILAPPKKS